MRIQILSKNIQVYVINPFVSSHTDIQTLNVDSSISRCLLSFAIWSALAGYSLSCKKKKKNFVQYL